MALAYKIREIMINQGIQDEIISQFCFPSPKETTLEHLINIATLMEKLLTKEQCLSIMEQQGCCKTGKLEVGNRSFLSCLSRAFSPLERKNPPKRVD